MTLAGITTVGAASGWLRERYIAAHARLAVAAEQDGSAFVAVAGIDLAVLASLLFPHANMMDLRARLTPPFVSLAHVLGPDPLGHDVARLALGGRISLLVGVLSVVGAVVGGTLAGLAAGYYRGIAEAIIMRLADVQLALPFIR